MLVGSCFIATLPIAALMMYRGFGIQSVGLSLLTTLIIVVVIRVVALKKLLAISAKYWVSKIVLPLLVTVSIVTLIGWIPQVWMAPSFGRLCITCLIVEGVLLPMLWYFLLDKSEREYLKGKILAGYDWLFLCYRVPMLPR
jgi:hypothetical protein